MTIFQAFVCLWIVATVYFVTIVVQLIKLEKTLKEKDMNITIITRKRETDE